MAKTKKKKARRRMKVCKVIEDLRPLLVEIGSIKEDPDNAKIHDARSLKAIELSLDTFGQRKCVVVNKKNRIIEAGNGIVMAAKQLRWTHVAAVFVEDDAESEIGYKLADNRTAELSSWDKDRLHAQLLSLEEMDFDIRITGFTAQDIREIGGEGGGTAQPEIEFSEELLMEHNYIVLYFDNVLDWEVAKEKFGLKTVKDLIPRKGQPKGIGRVVRGEDVLDRIV